MDLVSGRRGSNPRLSRWQRDALPLSYARDSGRNISRMPGALQVATLGPVLAALQRAT